MCKPIDRRRFKAALAVQDRGIKDAAEASGCSYHHLLCVIDGQRSPSKRLRAALRAFLGDSAWMYVTRDSDLLSEPEPTPPGGAPGSAACP